MPPSRRSLVVPLGVLIDVNGITDPNKIKAGQKLIIPSTSTESMEQEGDAPPPGVVMPAPVGILIKQKKLRLATPFFNAVEQEIDLIVLQLHCRGLCQERFRHLGAAREKGRS